jgi:hypothetical protein
MADGGTERESEDWNTLFKIEGERAKKRFFF